MKLNHLKICIACIAVFVFMSAIFSDNIVIYIFKIFGCKIDLAIYQRWAVICSFAVAYPWAILGLKSLLNKLFKRKLFSGLDKYKTQDDEIAIWIFVAIVIVISFSVYMNIQPNILNMKELLVFWVVAFITDLSMAIDVDDKGVNSPIESGKLLLVMSMLKESERQEVIGKLVLQFQNPELMRILNRYDANKLWLPVNTTSDSINLGQGNQNQPSGIKVLIDKWENGNKDERKEMYKDKDPLGIEKNSDLQK